MTFRTVLNRGDRASGAIGDPQAIVLPDPLNTARLDPPVGIDLKHIHMGYFGTFLVMHLIALLVIVPWFFSWAGVVAFVLGVIVFGQLGIPIGYHRLLTHRSFRAVKWFERTLVTLAMCSAQETPARWVAWHRMHHQHSDHREDPHSPLVNFLWSHMSWLIHEDRGNMKSYALFDTYARDILRDPYYMWIEKLPMPSTIFFLSHALVYFSISWLICAVFYGPGAEALQLALSLFVWGVVLRTVWVWHITWSVNSLTHLFGYRNFDTPDGSRNNWFVTLLTSGEGWHNNHHADQASVTVQLRWWELDVNYYAILFFKRLGLVSNLVPPRHIRQQSRRLVRSQVDDIGQNHSEETFNNSHWSRIDKKVIAARKTDVIATKCCAHTSLIHESTCPDLFQSNLSPNLPAQISQVVDPVLEH